MKLNLGNFVIDLNSPSTLVVFLALLFGAMILASYAGQPVKKFIRTNSGRLTTRRPTPKIKAKKSVKSSSLVPMSLKNKLMKQKSAKVTKTSKITNTSKLGKMKTTSKVVKKAKKQRSKSSSSVGGYSRSSSSTYRSASELDDIRKPCSRESYDDYY